MYFMNSTIKNRDFIIEKDLRSNGSEVYPWAFFSDIGILSIG